jgi:hypothetical protein
MPKSNAKSHYIMRVKLLPENPFLYPPLTLKFKKNFFLRFKVKGGTISSYVPKSKIKNNHFEEFLAHTVRDI